MPEKLLGAGRVFASHYQIVVCDDPMQPLSDDANWNWDHKKVAAGFAGLPTFRMLGTAADLNDHWIELVATDRPPALDDWQRILCAHFRTTNGAVLVMPIYGGDPTISAQVDPGDYSLYMAGQNIGVDQLSLGEDRKLSDAELAARKDLEWYRVFLVPGAPAEEGIVKDAA